jgi:hypothetical protein
MILAMVLASALMPVANTEAESRTRRSIGRIMHGAGCARDTIVSCQVLPCNGHSLTYFMHVGAPGLSEVRFHAACTCAGRLGLRTACSKSSGQAHEVAVVFVRPCSRGYAYELATRQRELTSTSL